MPKNALHSPTEIQVRELIKEALDEATETATKTVPWFSRITIETCTHLLTHIMEKKITLATALVTAMKVGFIIGTKASIHKWETKE